jgi:hypothetical protein
MRPIPLQCLSDLCPSVRLDRPLILWSIQCWQKPFQPLHLAFATTMFWSRICVVLVLVLVVCQGRAIALLWQALEHPSAIVSASISSGS